MKRKRGKGRGVQILEYALAYTVFSASGLLPWDALQLISLLLARALFLLSPKRRGIATENIRYALGIEDERKVKGMALRSFRHFFLTFLEIPKLRRVMNSPDVGMGYLRGMIDGLDDAIQRARAIHKGSGGCIFVTPHIGSWEMLPYLGRLADIPLTIIIRPLDNPYVERLLNREASGQIIMPKTNALLSLKETLRSGGSVGMLPDQSTMKGLLVDFFGRKATTTPIPAILALSCRRPIVTVSCCRASETGHYEVFISDPIWPAEAGDKKKEIVRLTGEMTRVMEGVIRRYPDQYLWMHNRWKRYRGKKEFLR
jgi:KDO2-lipid IV(A) lauroyltransferase